MKKNEKVFLELIKQGVYRVYKNGKIYKIKKTHCRWNGEYRKCRSILQHYKVRGYICIAFHYQEKQMWIRAHRVIWIYFNNNILKGLEINHKNGIKDDNRLSNLETVTRKENVNHAFKMGLRYNNFGENSSNHKLKNKDVLRIRKLLEKGIFQYKIAKIFNVSIGCIDAISNKRTWVWLN